MRIPPNSTARGLLGVAVASALLLGSTSAATATGAPGATVAPATMATAYTKTAADLRIASSADHPGHHRALRHLVLGAVLDATSNATIWRKNGDTAYKPASTTKRSPRRTRSRSGVPRPGPRRGCAPGRPRTGSSCRARGIPASPVPTSTPSRPPRPGGCSTAGSRPCGSTSTTTSSRRPPSPTGGRRATCPTRSARSGPWCATSASSTRAPRRPATSATGSWPTASRPRATTAAPTPPRPPRSSRAARVPSCRPSSAGCSSTATTRSPRPCTR